MTFFERGACRRVNRPVALTAAAQELRAEPAAVQAVFLSETPFGSFWKNGPLKILVEKHVVYKQLPAHHRADAVRRGLARKRWISPAKGGYREQKTWSQRYAIAEEIAERYGIEVACKSMSMGGSQIMGFHHARLGYATAYDMYKAFADDEQAHIDGFIDYLTAFKVANALRARDWATVALRYNGKGQVKAYSAKMAGHYRRSKLPKQILPYKPRPPRQIPQPSQPDVPAQPAPPAAKLGLFKLALDLIVSIFKRK